jgi:hypothetical protein
MISTLVYNDRNKTKKSDDKLKYNDLIIKLVMEILPSLDAAPRSWLLCMESRKTSATQRLTASRTLGTGRSSLRRMIHLIKWQFR